MSEQTPNYGNTERIPATLGAFSNLPCARRYTEGYEAPNPDQVKALIELSGLNRRQWAQLLGVTYSEKHGSTTLRKWTMKQDAKDYRQIPYTTWRLMLIYMGIVDAIKDREQLNLAG